MPLSTAASPHARTTFDRDGSPGSLALRLDYGDNYTGQHCRRVAVVASLLARDAGLDAASQHWFRIGALLHDIGKLTVPAAILNKRGPLTAEEWTVVRRHPVVGAAMVEGLAVGGDIRPMILHHHERWDGTGYPHCLPGLEIPFAARLLAIADAYDALTSTRSYRRAYTHAAALAAMRTQRGRAFDPSLLDLFIMVTEKRLRRGVTRPPLLARRALLGNVA